MKAHAEISEPVSPITGAVLPAARLRSLQALGVFCGFVAGAWLGGAEAPIKIVNSEISPVTISFVMVCGVFLARWSVPALIRGTAHVRSDVRHAPHLIVWAVLAGCMWAVANTLTIYAIRNVGLSIAFPLWNTNSLLGIFWGVVLFKELRSAGWKSWMGVLGGAVCMFAGAALLAIASSHQTAPGKAVLGVAAALGAGALWGTMYVPYRKAYLTGMNPLSFVTFFTIGELVTMLLLALKFEGAAELSYELVSAKGILFWLMLGGFVWVIGDLFQQYATKYVGISRGIPLSNTNQLWGLLWGVLVFRELRNTSHGTLAQVVAGSILMALGAVAIALSSATGREHSSWQEVAAREGRRYGIEDGYVRAGMSGHEYANTPARRSFADLVLIVLATGVFVAFALMARIPQTAVSFGWAAGLITTMFVLLAGCGIALWRTTRFR